MNRKARDKDQLGKRRDRTKIRADTEADILTASRRRCCICSGLRRDYAVKTGQIAHLDHDPSNNDPDNLAFLCLYDHDEYDSQTSQSKGFTIKEVKKYRAELLEFVTRSTPPSDGDRTEWRARIERWRRMIVDAERKYKSGKEPGVSFAEVFQRQPGYVQLEPYLFAEAIAALKDDRLGRAPKVIGMVDGKEFVNPPDALRSILARELTRLELLQDLGVASASSVKLQPQLDITFDENGSGFVHSFLGETPDGRRQIVEWKLYRVAITSHVSTSTRLKIDEVVLKGGDRYHNLFLRIMGHPELTDFKLNAGDPHLWDVVEKPVGGDWVSPTHKVKTVQRFLLQAPCQFRITASCDQGFGISKLVTLDIDQANNNELKFQITDD